MKICKDGRIWGQNNKEAGSHLGIRTDKDRHIKKGYNPNSANSKTKFKKGDQVGEKNTNWKGGSCKTAEGYILIKSRETNKYIAEHRLVMEQSLGCCLRPRERIHHLNGNKSDNRIENLLLCDSLSEHRKLHHKMEKFVCELIKKGKIVYDRHNKNFKLT